MGVMVGTDGERERESRGNPFCQFDLMMMMMMATLKVDVTVRLEFELAYYNMTVENVGPDATCIFNSESDKLSFKKIPRVHISMRGYFIVFVVNLAFSHWNTQTSRATSLYEDQDYFGGYIYLVIGDEGRVYVLSDAHVSTSRVERCLGDHAKRVFLKW